jgi:oligosaccharide translocation protein RFT1
VARIVFQPIEETLRVFFSRTLGAGTAKSTPQSKPKPKSQPIPSTQEHDTALIEASTALISVLATQTSLSLILLVFGTAYLPLLLPLLLPPAYLATSAPSVLAAWVWYIPVLAVNGALEAFLASVATPQDLNRQSRCVLETPSHSIDHHS